jgi:hypothetical protein
MAYFSNSTEGDKLEQQCETCPAGNLSDEQIQRVSSCPIALVQLLYNYDQLKKGNEQLKEAMATLIDKEGICQMRPILLDIHPPPKKGEPPNWLLEDI